MEILQGIIDAYPYEIVFVDRTHTVRYMNRTAKRRYGDAVNVGNSLFNCHNERTKPKIEAFLKRADEGEEEMFETLNGQTGEWEFFTPVRNKEGKVIGYFERHEAPWKPENAAVPIGDYWERRKEEQYADPLTQ
ncbi:MAG: PAS domain-containing protein [Clostridia bacterium]|nr:PAS domain-containing protein [Clostridia bacterium]